MSILTLAACSLAIKEYQRGSVPARELSSSEAAAQKMAKVGFVSKPVLESVSPKRLPLPLPSELRANVSSLEIIRGLIKRNEKEGNQNLAEWVNTYQMPLSLLSESEIEVIKNDLQSINLVQYSQFASDKEFQTFLKKFPKMTSLKIVNQPKITFLRSLPTLSTLSIMHCPDLTTISDLSALANLKCHICENLEVISKLPALKSFAHSDCPKLKDFPILKGKSEIAPNIGHDLKKLMSAPDKESRQPGVPSKFSVSPFSSALIIQA